MQHVSIGAAEIRKLMKLDFAALVVEATVVYPNAVL